MSDNGHNVDISAADQLGLGFIADGNDLFDLGHMPVAESTPVWAMAPDLSGHDSLASDLIAFDAGDHGQHPSYLQVAGLDQAAISFPAPHAVSETPVQASPDVHPASVDQPGHVAVDSGGATHTPTLSLADILADAADDLANFHTAAGGGHVPMGSGFFTPFHPIEPLAGFTELQVISAH
jgi:hypothetical protein